MKAVVLLLLIFITAGCVQTGEFIENKTTETTETTTKEITDTCYGIICEDSVITCEDGFIANCSNFCENGTCTDCTPDCTGHDCLENWVCTDWSTCSDGKQTRTCNDVNSYGTETNKPAETQDCVEEDNIVIEYIYYESPEWVRILNNGNTAICIGSWSLNDEAGHIYIFPIGFILGPHESVSVHTEKGSDTEKDLYMNKGRPIWNNDGDKATLRNENGIIVDEYSYPIKETTTTTSTITTTSTTTTTTINETTTTTISEETTTTVPEVTTTTILETTTTIPETTTTTVPEAQAEITSIQFDAPGSDNSTNLNDEWVKISGSGDMTGWTLEDERNHVYTFPEGFVLYDIVTIHTGSGSDTQNDLYWGRGSHVWNNDGDTATLRNSIGDIISQMS